MTPDAPSRILNPAEALAANTVLRRPPGVPQGELKKSDFRKAHEETLCAPPTSLGDGREYHMLGLLYQLIGIDRSLIELFAQAADKRLQFVTYQAPKPVFDVVGAPAHSWHTILQGLDPQDSQVFIEHVQSYAFREPAGGVWTANMRVLRVLDPFSDDRRGQTIYLWFPEYNGQPYAILRRAPGLHLHTPVVEVRAHARA